jgi:hypothetical protein
MKRFHPEMMRNEKRLPKKMQHVIIFIILVLVFHIVDTASGFSHNEISFGVAVSRTRRSRRRKVDCCRIQMTGTEIENNPGDVLRNVRFISPLLEYGYRPTVEQYENNTLSEKPLLLYLPGFDGTFLSPFLQFPELDTIFDIRCMVVPMKNRSNLDELIGIVIDYLRREGSFGRNETDVLEPENATSGERAHRPIYITGESFGGILTLLTAVSIKNDPSINLKGLILINPATCYDRSKLAVEAPKVAALPSGLYIFGLLRLVPLFTDEYSLGQLLLILKAEALPSVIDNETREAYMGRVAFSLPFVLPFIDQAALNFRLTEWLAEGCSRMTAAAASGDSLFQLQNFRYLIVAGEKDGTLPSVAEAERLASLMPDTVCHIVDGAGHASTCGSRVDLAALCRFRFPELCADAADRTSMKEVAAKGKGIWLGMEPRYDNAKIGLSPLKYWDDGYYRNVKRS